MIDESTISDLHDDCLQFGGCVGVVTFDHQPKATPARVRPFIWAFLLLRGAVRRYEIEASLIGHVADDDCKVWDDEHERTPLQVVVDDVLGEMVAQGLLRLSRDVNNDLYVLRQQAMAQAISMTCQLNAQLPDHLLMEVHGKE